MVKLQSLTKQDEFQYYALPDTDLADVIICRNQALVDQTDPEGHTSQVYEYDCNQFRTSLDKDTIKANLDFYFTFKPDIDQDYPKKIKDLENKVNDVQIAICEIYQNMEGLTE